MMSGLRKGNLGGHVTGSTGGHIVVLLTCAFILALGRSRAESAQAEQIKANDATVLETKAALIRKSKGDGHHLTRQAWIDLANHYCVVHRDREAAELWKLIAQSRETSLGFKSGLTADAYYQAGRLFLQSRETTTAEECLERCVALCPIKPGDGGLLIDYYGLLAYAQFQNRHWAKVCQTCRLCLALRHTHVDTEARAHRRLALALSEMKAFQEAKLEMELAMLRYSTWSETDSIDGIDAQLDYSRILRGCGKLVDSEQLLRSLLVGTGRVSQRDIPITFRVCHELAVTLQLANKVSEARTYSERALSGLREWKELSPWSDDIQNLHKQLHEAKSDRSSK